MLVTFICKKTGMLTYKKTAVYTPVGGNRHMKIKKKLQKS